ncbi:MAG: radical SAM protein [Desulfobacter sp.]|nr:MAG: radical SAM protein [Desulfobacter sp.]
MKNNDPTPFTLMLEPVGACDLKCRHCYARLRQGHAMDQDLLALILEKVRAYLAAEGMTRVNLIWHGGEPLLAGLAFFKAALEQIRKRWPGIRTSHFIQTNGLAMDKDFCCFFRDNGFQLGLSLDGPADVHDRLRVDARGKGTHDRVMKIVDLIYSADLPVGFNAVVSRASLGQEERIYKFFNGLGAGFRINPIIPGRHPEAFAALALAPGEYGRIMARFFDLWTGPHTGRVPVSPLDGYLLGISSGDTGECIHSENCAEARAAIKPHGEMALCSRFQDLGQGQIQDHSLRFLLNSGVCRQIRERAGKLKDCRSCAWRPLCHGGCPFNSHSRGRGIMEKDPFCRDYQYIFSHMAEAMVRTAPPRKAGP